MDDWFRFVVGTVVSFLTALAGWFAHTLFAYNDKISKLETRIAVLENADHVDPTHYIKAVTEMSSAIAHLTATIVDLKREVMGLRAELAERKGQRSL